MERCCCKMSWLRESRRHDMQELARMGAAAVGSCVLWLVGMKVNKQSW
jgi:hypothetical protein